MNETELEPTSYYGFPVYGDNGDYISVDDHEKFMEIVPLVVEEHLPNWVCLCKSDDPLFQELSKSDLAEHGHYLDFDSFVLAIRSGIEGGFIRVRNFGSVQRKERGDKRFEPLYSGGYIVVERGSEAHNIWELKNIKRQPLTEEFEFV